MNALKVILWADEPDHALPVRATLRQAGHTAMIRDARAFQSSDAERCDAIAFIAAGRRDAILAAYRSPQAIERFGEVRVYDVETGDFGEPLSVPDLGVVETPPPAPSERDLLNARLDNMTDQDLRTYVRGVTGAEVPAGATRDELEAMLRQAKPGEGKLASSGVAATPEPQEQRDASAETAPTETAATEQVSPPPPAEEQRSGRGSRGRNNRQREASES